MSREQPGLVGDAFGENLFAVDAEVGKGAVGVELCGEFGGGRVILSAIFGGPPIAEAAVSVVDVSKFVEAMGDFMGHSGASGSVIGGGVALGIEIRRLQNGGGEKFGVGAEHDHRAGDLRIDRPLDGIDRLFQFGEIACAKKSFGATHISECVAADDFERRIVDPCVGVADDEFKRGQFG